jgi:hypothetical protein
MKKYSLSHENTDQLVHLWALVHSGQIFWPGGFIFYAHQQPN